MADQIYYSVFTQQGLALLTQSIQNGTKLGITAMAFGDGGGSLPVPSDEFTSLINEVHRTQLNSLAPDPNNANWLRAEAIIASATGGFNIRELGLYAGDVLIAYSNYPATYKPNPSDGTARIMTFRMILQIDNVANFELVIDPDVVLATIQYVNENASDKKIKTWSGRFQEDKNKESITPFDFGAIGDGTSHTLSERYNTLEAAQAVYPHAIALTDEVDWCAVQALFNELRYKPSRYLKYKIDISGQFYLTRGVKFKVAATGQSTHRTLHGDFVAICSNMEIGTKAVFELHGTAIQVVDTININCEKKADYGVWVSDGYYLQSGQAAINFGIKLGRCYIANSRIYGVIFNDSAMFSTVDFMRSSANGTTITTTVSAITHTTINALSNQSTLTIATVPTVSPTDTPILLDYNGRVSKVLSIDSTNKTITVSPAVVYTAGAFSNVKIYFGGAVRTLGSNTAGILINQISTATSAIGISHASMYPCQINYFCSEFSGVALYSEGLVGGIKCSHTYFEGDSWQYIQNTDGYGLAGTSNLDYGTGIDIKKCDAIRWSRDTSTGQVIPSTYAGIVGFRVYEKGSIHRMLKLSANHIPPTFVLNFNTPYEIKSEHSNGLTINFSAIDTAYNEKFGYDTQSVLVTGSGNNAAPTGTITIKKLDDYTLNGGTSDLTFSGFSSAAFITAKLLVAAKNIIVSVSNMNTTKKGTTANRPTAPTIGQKYYDTTLLAAGKPIEWNGASWVDATGATV